MSASELGPIGIRRAVSADWETIFALIPRLVEFGPPAWRDPVAMSATDRKVIGAALQSLHDDPAVIVAVAPEVGVVGFLHVHSVLDYYTQRKHGHVADIVVTGAYEGRGIGRQLLAAAEDWARSQHYEWLTISVFAENGRAARTYDQLGFKPDIARLLKPLR
jgi:GNAT superfamily N-acetyltransferase